MLDEICVLRTTPVASVPPRSGLPVCPNRTGCRVALPSAPRHPPPQRSVVSCGARHRCARSLVIFYLSSRAGARLSRWRGFGGEGERAWDENRFALLLRTAASAVAASGIRFTWTHSSAAAVSSSSSSSSKLQRESR